MTTLRRISETTGVSHSHSSPQLSPPFTALHKAHSSDSKKCFADLSRLRLRMTIFSRRFLVTHVTLSHSTPIFMTKKFLAIEVRQLAHACGLLI